MQCPLCGSNLELKQINFKIAVFICVDLKCPYPVGAECIQVERNYQEMMKTPQKYPKNKVHESPQTNTTIKCKETENTMVQSNISQPLEIINPSHEKMIHNNQINVCETIDGINLEQTNFDLSNVEDLDEFISDLLK